MGGLDEMKGHITKIVIELKGKVELQSNSGLYC